MSMGLSGVNPLGKDPLRPVPASAFDDLQASMGNTAGEPMDPGLYAARMNGLREKWAGEREEFSKAARMACDDMERAALKFKEVRVTHVEQRALPMFPDKVICYRKAPTLWEHLWERIKKYFQNIFKKVLTLSALVIQ